MKSKISNVLSVILVIFIGSVIFLLFDYGLVLCGEIIRVPAMVIIYILTILNLLLFSFRVHKSTLKRRFTVSVSIVCIISIICCSLFAAFKVYGDKVAYRYTESGKEALYSDKRVMVIVPHPDDDINLTGGVLNEYINYGSEVYLVFVTNGDKFGKGKTRLKEAIKLNTTLGIPEENIIFLGYGDAWDESAAHIYNSTGDEQVTSFIGNTNTYGLKSHPAYNDGAEYTYNNYFSDVKNVILEYMPEIIFCNDYDKHADHRAVSLTFEAAMGEILKENADYRPYIFKGYCYTTSYKAFMDFYDEINVKSTRQPRRTDHDIYNWSERIRLPIESDSISRSMYGNKIFDELSVYRSQIINYKAEKIINADKVFWQRSTQSLCYNAEITVSSNSDGNHLNDFKLLDSNDVNDLERPPYDNVWTPDSSDTKKTATVTFDAPTDIAQIYLYDNPSPDDNITDARIRFDDGTEISTGRLYKRGSAKKIDVNKKNVKSFEVIIDRYKGDNYGLTEIEAYSSVDLAAKGMDFIKLTDENDEFVYDYYTDETGSVKLSLYSLGCSDEFNGSNYSFDWDNEQCEVGFVDGFLTVKCPEGESCTLKVQNKNNPELSDTVIITNLTEKDRKHFEFMKGLEKFLFRKTANRAYRSLTVYRIYYHFNPDENK